MFFLLMLFVFGYTFFMQRMDFDKDVMWLQLVKHDEVAQNVYPKPPLKYYFEQIFYPKKCEKSELLVNKIRGANSYYEHSMILNESNEYLRIDSRTKGIKLSELERKVSRIVVFLDTENKIIGTISNIQLGMFFCHNR